MRMQTLRFALLDISNNRKSECGYVVSGEGANLHAANLAEY